MDVNEDLFCNDHSVRVFITIITVLSHKKGYSTILDSNYSRFRALMKNIDASRLVHYLKQSVDYKHLLIWNDIGSARVSLISNYDIGKLGRAVLPREVVIRHGGHDPAYRPTSLV